MQTLYHATPRPVKRQRQAIGRSLIFVTILAAWPLYSCRGRVDVEPMPEVERFAARSCPSGWSFLMTDYVVVGRQLREQVVCQRGAAR